MEALLAPRRRMRTADDMTPVAAALAAPLPKGVDAALAKIEAAEKAVKGAYEMLSEARTATPRWPSTPS